MKPMILNDDPISRKESAARKEAATMRCYYHPGWNAYMESMLRYICDSGISRIRIAMGVKDLNHQNPDRSMHFIQEPELTV